MRRMLIFVIAISLLAACQAPTLDASNAIKFKLSSSAFEDNGLSQTGYMGPCPPGGIHRYDFCLYALAVPSLNLKAGASRSEVENAMKNHVIGLADTMGRYEQQ